MKPVIAVTAGDYNGVGPEIILKVFSDKEINSLADFRIIGTKLIFDLTYDTFFNKSQYSIGYNYVIEHLSKPDNFEEISEDNFIPSKPSKISGSAAYSFLIEAVKLCQENKASGVVTAPVTKETLFPKNEKFNGQTEWFAHKTESKLYLMLMVTGNTRIAVVTTHIALKEVYSELSIEEIIEKGRILKRSLKWDFGIKTPSIAVCGLNPHCGENGRFGNEETELIVPAVNALRSEGGSWTGPVPADGLFSGKNYFKFDGILAMYHDQGLIPFKLISGLSGVNFTAGLPVVRTSPDHGTAMDIAGKDRAETDSFKEAIRTAVEIIHRRSS